MTQRVRRICMRPPFNGISGVSGR